MNKIAGFLVIATMLAVLMLSAQFVAAAPEAPGEPENPTPPPLVNDPQEPSYGPGQGTNNMGTGSQGKGNGKENGKGHNK
jgi:hypothetical protein